MSNNKADKNTPAYWLRQIATARHSLVLILIFTVINLVSVLADLDSYFLFSASVPYYLTLYFKGIDNGFAYGDWDINGEYTMIALVISAVILGIYLLFWFLSKNKPGWLAAALVLFVLDTLALFWVTFNLLADSSGNIVDFLIHAWAILEMIQALVANGKLKKYRLSQTQVPVSNGPEF